MFYLSILGINDVEHIAMARWICQISSNGCRLIDDPFSHELLGRDQYS